MTGTPARSTWLPLAAVLAFNASTVVAVLAFGAPMGNVWLLYYIETIVAGLAALTLVWRAERAGQTELLPLRSGPTAYLGVLFGVYALILGIFAIGATVISGYTFSLLAFWVPLALLLARQAADLVGCSSRQASVGEQAALSLGSVVLRIIILVVAISAWVAVSRDFLPTADSRTIGVVALIALALVKSLVEGWVARHPLRFTPATRPNSAATGRRRPRTSRGGTGSN